VKNEIVYTLSFMEKDLSEQAVFPALCSGADLALRSDLYTQFFRYPGQGW
jgi:hypothetical protein